MASGGGQPVRSKSVTLLAPQGDNEDGSGSRKVGIYGRNASLCSLPRSTAVASANEKGDEFIQQTTPLMKRVTDVGHRQGATPEHSHLTGENEYFEQGETTNMDTGDPYKPIAPTGKLAWIGFGMSVFALACMCISFASPYWLQQWELSFNTFNNMGLWEACFHNYMHHRDDLQEIYNGCFWVYNADERYNKLRDWLIPPWFISCQVMSTIVLLVLIATVIMMALVFLHMCPMMNHEYHQIFAMFIAGAMLFLCTMTIIITGILFGVQIQDRNWMPRPDWNMLSWGYGFLIICGIFSLAAGFALFTAAWKSYNELLRNQDEYFKQAMERASQFAPSVSQASYGPGMAGYAEKPSYSTQPSYYSQPSYEKEGYDRPSYDKHPSSQSMEKVRYEPQQSYDSRYDARRQQSIEQPPPSYNGAQARYAQQQSHDGDRSYDSRGDRSYDSRGGYDQHQGYDQYGQQRA